MAPHIHTVDPVQHERFLSEQRKDPFTKEEIKAGDRIVFCANCKSAFLYDSWQLMQGRHCNQQDTLREFVDLESIETEINERHTATSQETQSSEEFDLEQMQNHQNQTEEEREEIEDLILYVKDLYSDANSEDNEDNKQQLIKLFSKLRDYLIANPEEYYGKAIVTPALIQQAHVASRTVTVSNFTNFIFSSPLLYYAFSFLGPGFAIGATIASGLGLQAFSNSTAAAVAGRTSNNKIMPILAAASMILINGVLTMGSGIGSELLLNGTGLAEQHAKELAEKYIQGQKEAANKKNSQYYDDYINLKKECEDGLKRLDSPDGIEKSRLYERLKGDHKDRNRLDEVYPSSASKEKIDGYPLCPKANGYKDLVDRNKDINDARKELDSLKKTRNNLGNDIDFLKKNAINIYQNNFRNNGELKNGSLAVEKALETLWEKTFSGNLKQLGFPLFLFLISLVTSLTACAFVFCLSLRKDSSESHSEVALREIDNWIYETWKQLRNKQRDDFSESNPQNPRLNYEEQQLIIYLKKLIKDKGLNNDVNSLYSAIRNALWIEREYQQEHKKIFLLQSQGVSFKKLFYNNFSENEYITFDINRFKQNVENSLGLSGEVTQNNTNNNHR